MEQYALSSKQDQERHTRFWAMEHELQAACSGLVAGVDEAGRGPLAGPVVVAAVILPIDFWTPGLNDSKQMTPGARARAFAAIQAGAIAWAIEAVPVNVIDRINILRATYKGMRAALRALHPAPALALVDGHPLPASPVPQRNIIHGDGRCASIAAASVLAKVHRDLLMIELDVCYPGYGFAHHKGYATPDHLAALQRLGVCPAHRRSFAPVQDCLQRTLF